MLKERERERDRGSKKKKRKKIEKNEWKGNNVKKIEEVKQKMMNDEGNEKTKNRGVSKLKKKKIGKEKGEEGSNISCL